MKNKLLILFLYGLFFLLGYQAYSQDKRHTFKDSTDGAFDVSDWLLNKKGFLFVPAIITEPALDYGGGGGLVFFHSSYSEKSGPPSLTVVLGGGTANGTWSAGLVHLGFWKEDRIRYMGALIKPYVNIKFYGSGRVDFLKDNPVLMNMDAWLLVQQVKFRIAESNFFLGGRYLLYDTHNSFEIPINIPEFEGIKFNSTLSELSLLADYESRNNVFSPTKGLFFELVATYSDDWLGGDGLYGRLWTTLLGYVPASKTLNVGIRYENSFSFGDIPFYAKPMIRLRGAPLMKYQNDYTSVIESQLTWNMYKRWSLLGFTGIGTAFSDFGKIDEGKTVISLGSGFRYKIARKFGMNMGMDFAVANGDFAFYFVVGSAWLR
jgi:hypothetical protein